MLVGVSVVLYQYRVFITWISTQSSLQNIKVYKNTKYAEIIKRDNRTIVCTEKEITTQLPVSINNTYSHLINYQLDKSTIRKYGERSRKR